LFVECSPAQGEKIIENVKADLPQKKIEVWHLNQPILFVQGLEYSFYESENNQIKKGWESEEIYPISTRLPKF